MRILAVGGGSGGHVTPVLAVINELSKQEPNLEAHFICDHAFGAQAENIMKKAPLPVKTYKIHAGKLRRYHGVSLVKQLLDVPTTIQNIRDLFFVGVGAAQSAYYLMKIRPDAVFTKGGFVCLPVGMIAALFRIPLVIHDSDAHPGLTNRLLARWANSIATGAPLENYNYDKSKSKYVGIPVDVAFHPYSDEERRRAKRQLGLPDINRPLVVVTGGGLGAKRLNDSILHVANEVLEHAAVLHIAGNNNGEEVAEAAPSRADYKVVPFVASGMARVLGAADVVVTRAGATTMAELAALGSVSIIVPNAMLTGGHQTKNAAVFGDAQAAEVLSEEALKATPELLKDTIVRLLTNADRRSTLQLNIAKFAKREAAADVARMIADAVAGKHRAAAEKAVR